MSWEATGLDPRLLRALGKRNFERPTPVQAEAIPAALAGRDVVARARTGSGKTLAYLLPAFHRLLAGKGGKEGWQALVLVPTRELCEQVRAEAEAVATQLGAGFTVTAISGDGGGHRAAVAAAGQVVVSTPAKIAQILAEGLLTGAQLEGRLAVLVLDEADLLLSFGYEEDVRALAPHVPRSCQCMLLSATTSADVDRLTKLVLHNPVSLDLLGSGTADGTVDGTAGGTAGGAAAEIEHLRLDLPRGEASGGPAAETSEKLLHLLALLKLNLVQRKVLVFVNSPESGMRVRLFLEAFGVRAAVLNAELPLNSRHHILQEFNRGLFDHLIATDDVHAAPAADEAPPAKRQRKGKEGAAGGRRGKGKGGPAMDEEFGVTRGIDFKGVATVVNFDMPGSVQGYVHRVGRTGRGGAAGTAITLLGPSDAAFAAEVEAMLAAGGDAAAAADAGDGAPVGAAAAAAAAAGRSWAPFPHLTRLAVDGLRYRSEDVARSITKAVIKEARSKELRQELLNSKRLAAFFEEHPGELRLLKHDRPLAAAGAPGASAPHLKHIPAYLRDPALQARGGASGGGAAGGRLPARKRRKTEGTDPLKGFARAPRRGGDKHEPLTEMELKADAAGKKARRKAASGGGAGAFKPKANVRKNKGRKR